jgi:hypothetical protein
MMRRKNLSDHVAHCWHTLRSAHFGCQRPPRPDRYALDSAVVQDVVHPIDPVPECVYCDVTSVQTLRDLAPLLRVLQAFL